MRNFALASRYSLIAPRRLLERIYSVHCVGHCGGLDRVPAGQLNGAPAYYRSTDEDSLGRSLLEYVHHRHSGGCDSGAVVALSGADCRLHPHLSQGRRRQAQLAESSHLAHPDCLCLYVGSLPGAAQVERRESATSQQDRSGAAHRRHRDVDRRCLGRPPRGEHVRRGGDVAAPGHLDRDLPNAVGGLSRNLALHVHHRRRPDSRPSCSPFPP